MQSTLCRFIPVLVGALSDHTHLVNAGTTLETNPLTISEKGTNFELKKLKG